MGVGGTKIDDPKIWNFSLIKMLEYQRLYKNIIRPNLTHNSIKKIQLLIAQQKIAHEYSNKIGWINIKSSWYQ